MSAVLERGTLIDQGDVDRWSCRCVFKPTSGRTHSQLRQSAAQLLCDVVQLLQLGLLLPSILAHNLLLQPLIWLEGERVCEEQTGELEMCQKVEAVNAAVNVRRLHEKHIRCHMFHCYLVLIQVCWFGWFSCSSLICLNLKIPRCAGRPRSWAVCGSWTHKNQSHCSGHISPPAE